MQGGMYEKAWEEVLVCTGIVWSYRTGCMGCGKYLFVTEMVVLLALSVVFVMMKREKTAR